MSVEFKETDEPLDYDEQQQVIQQTPVPTYGNNVFQDTNAPLDYNEQQPVIEATPTPAYDNKEFYQRALNILGALAVGGLIGMVAISAYQLCINADIEIPDALVATVSVSVGAIAGLFSRK